MIICIGREFGSGGHEIGRKVAEKLGLELYDRDLIDRAAEKIIAMPKDVLEKADEKKRNPWLHEVWYDVPNQELNGMTATERAQLPVEELAAIQGQELSAVTAAYVVLGLVMLVLLLAIRLTKMPNLSEKGEKVEFAATLRRLIKNRNYVWGVVAQFFNIGAQIAVWSFVIRYAMQQLNFDGVLASLGDSASAEAVVNALRGVEPVAAAFYNGCEWLGLDDLLPRTAEQAAATYYIMSLILFVTMRFVCTAMMKYVKAYKLLIGLALLAVMCCLGAMFGKGSFGVYCLMGISGCMSLMFPTIYGFGLTGLGNDTKIGGSFMVMAIAGAAVLTQIQGIVSDQTGSIMAAYVVPAVAFAVIAYYGFFIARKQESGDCM